MKRNLNDVISDDNEPQDMEAMLRILHTLPPREPVIDLWAELAPKVAEIQAEDRLGVIERLQLRGHRFLSNFASGAILFTQAFAMNTQRKMQKYVLHDSYRVEEA